MIFMGATEILSPIALGQKIGVVRGGNIFNLRSYLISDITSETPQRKMSHRLQKTTIQTTIALYIIGLLTLRKHRRRGSSIGRACGSYLISHLKVASSSLAFGYFVFFSFMPEATVGHP